MWWQRHSLEVHIRSYQDRVSVAQSQSLSSECRGFRMYYIQWAGETSRYWWNNESWSLHRDPEESDVASASNLLGRHYLFQYDNDPQHKFFISNFDFSIRRKSQYLNGTSKALTWTLLSICGKKWTGCKVLKIQEISKGSRSLAEELRCFSP